jgi:hypothetical protein
LKQVPEEADEVLSGQLNRRYGRRKRQPFPDVKADIKPDILTDDRSQNIL